MKFSLEAIKAAIAGFNRYQRAAALTLAFAVPACVGMGSASAVKYANGAGLPTNVNQPGSSSVVTSVESGLSGSSYEEKKDIKIQLLPSSVEEDLEVQVADEKGQLVIGPEFVLVVKGVKNGYNHEWKVNDGFLKLTKLTPGEYTVSIKPMEGYIMPEAVTCKVSEKVAHKVIDVSKIVVEDSKVDASKEDNAFGTVPQRTPEPPKDTVEYVKPSVTEKPKPVEPDKIKYKYVAKASPEGKLYYKDGTVSDVYGEFDKDGYLIGAYTLEMPVTPRSLSFFGALTMPFQIVAYAEETDGEGTGSEGTPTPATTEGGENNPTETPTTTETPAVTDQPTQKPEGGENTPSPSPDTTTPSSSDSTQGSNSNTSSDSDSSGTSSGSNTSTGPTPSTDPTEKPTPSPSPSAEPTPSPTPTPVKKKYNLFNSDGSLTEDAKKKFDITDKTVTQETIKVYTGWQEIDGAKYYFDKNGKKVTGTQVIGGVTYFFGSDGKLQNKNYTLGVDVSKYQQTINWKSVKESGVEFAIIRVGYRGYGTGVLVRDHTFKTNIEGALNAGLKVGVYIFSQAITTQEAVEEASMCVQYTNGYSLALPIFFDSEYSTSAKTGRADGLSKSQRTAIAQAFCETVRNSGKRAGVYASKSWFYNQLDYSRIQNYDIWVAHYTRNTDFAYRYDIWQYTGSGSVPGINTAVDMNYCYKAY